ncbi:unnamed protein product [Psylliodes chrysocephalus]|uniref:Enoyl reductase (ER) domain-containing protein n=1 Tax=Psylliodes chrysocephalus TaxID=3402493 RepID=A0A9P0CUQ8_9CUCU|nr:unnamed protein product [Psylliodes chrysocephala]
MDMVAAKSLATTVTADPGFFWEVPEKCSTEEAATFPVVYGTSYYALVVRGLKSGESLLVHAGTGGVGWVSIAIALHMGCTVFTTSDAVKSLPNTVYNENQVEQALRYMASGKHIGKIREEESRTTQHPAVKTVSAIPRTYMDPEKTYVLVGGLGGFGLELAN